MRLNSSALLFSCLMKTKSKSVKRKISDTDNLQSYMMGPSKKLNLGTPSTFTNLHGQDPSSDEQRNQTGIRDIHMNIQDATEYSSITSNNHISSCTLPHIQNTQHQNSFTKTVNINTKNENVNLPTTHLQANDQSEICPHELKKAMSRTEVGETVVGNTHKSNIHVTIDNHNNLSTVTINDNMQTTPSTCNIRSKRVQQQNIRRRNRAGFGASAIYNKCCNRGRVVLRVPPEYPMYIKNLYANHHFMENIRAYNQMFSMTSLGANIDSSINNGRGPYVFRISGQNYHWIGSMCPEEGNMPRFLQLYIYDTTNEVQNRMAHFGGEEESGLKRDIVEGLIDLLDNHNALVLLFRTARNKRMEANIPEFKLRLYNVIGTRRYDLPTPETIGEVIFGGKTAAESEFDLIIEEHSQIPQRVANNQKRMSMNMYYAYQIHDRLNHYNLLPRGGKLFQQYVVTAYCAIEQSRLDYIRQNQNDIRNEYLSGIYDAISRGDRDGNDLGTRTILSISFTGGPRYMYAHYLDALAICRVHGNPSFFITFTCNANWPEIQEYMDSWPELTTADRADIVDRVFEQKKRGLPHCHSLLWVSPSTKVQQDTDVDKYISAELPDPTQDPDGYRIILELMTHGPCGYANKNASCMKDGNKCNRNFPKPYCNATYIDKDGFVHYRRRDTNIDIERQEVRLDNSYVVPFNRALCMRFYAHINVEYCGWTMLIKYLFKYISKGTDRVVANITTPIGATTSTSNTQSIYIDEIKNFVGGSYIGPHEACWRILMFPIHYRDPAVLTLAMHLENMQQIRFRSKDNLQAIVDNPTKKKTTLIEWRRQNKSVIGRLTYIHPKQHEALGLIGDDQEWVTALEEAALHASSDELRKLFVQILMFNDVSDPTQLWHKFWKEMSHDITRRLSRLLQIPQVEQNETEMKAGTLFEIEAILNSNSRTLKDFGLPMPPRRLLNILENRVIMEERNYNRELLQEEKDILLPKLNKDQKLILDEILNGVTNN
ncbi:DNA helicase [Tanacetum coccineum]